MSLATQFGLVATLVIGIAMAVLGSWIAQRIEAAVTRNTAVSAALYMDRFVEPHVQDLVSGRTLSIKSSEQLSELLKTKRMSRQILDLKIWLPDGSVAYSTKTALIGQKMPISDSLREALNGRVAAEFDSLDDEENVLERDFRVTLLEIYSPLREAKTDKIIAVAEFYQVSDELAAELTRAKFESALIVGGLSLFVLGALVGTVRKGSRTIINQQKALNSQIAELSRSLAANNELRHRLANANRRVTEGGERFLRRISADLHDGPVQLIGLALLRLDDICTGFDATTGTGRSREGDETLEIVRGTLKDALSEIRGLSHGFALPELENFSLAETLTYAIVNHERRTGLPVLADLTHSLPEVAASIKICAYRFVQEGLNNAFRHAGGSGQGVEARWQNEKLEITVRDSGPGMSNTATISMDGGLGLVGMRDRVEALGGVMTIETGEKDGTRLKAVFCAKILEKEA